jgi:polyhydroxybutyrate depolymerase
MRLLPRSIKGLLILALLVAGVGSLSPAAAASCTLQSTGGLRTITMGSRMYQLYVPASLATLPAGTRVPLLVTFHGLASNGTQHASQTGWPSFAETHQFIAAFPEGQYLSWNYFAGSPDIGFARAVVSQIESTYCVDASRVYASGHSNGAFFAQRLACDVSDVFASVTEYAGSDPTFLGSAPCSAKRPVAVGMFQGDLDPVVPAVWAQNDRDAWVTRLHCSAAPTVAPVSDGTVDRYGGCAGGVEVLWRLYAGQGHLWPTGARSEDIKTTMWNFLSRYPLPASPVGDLRG